MMQNGIKIIAAVAVFAAAAWAIYPVGLRLEHIDDAAVPAVVAAEEGQISPSPVGYLSPVPAAKNREDVVNWHLDAAYQSSLSDVISADEAYEVALAIMQCPPEPDAPSPAERGTAAVADEPECRKLSREVSIYQLAKYAASSGNSKAQLYFSGIAAGVFNDATAALNVEIISDYKESSLRFLEQAARGGEREALLRLADNYEMGSFSEKNAVLAYAYAEAYARHSQSVRARTYAASLAKALRADEFSEARDIALRL